MKSVILRALAASLPFLPFASAALAHTGAGAAHGFQHGFLHPLGGLDHMLAMIAVGLFAAHLGARALWLVPASFVALMAAGGAIGFAEIRLPYVEIGIGLSVVVFGGLVALRAQMAVAAATIIVGAFAVFHGHAHGAELPDGASPYPYAAGFMLATALLHTAGLVLGIGVANFSERLGPRILRVGGGAMALTGVALLARTAIS